MRLAQFVMRKALEGLVRAMILPSISAQKAIVETAQVIVADHATGHADPDWSSI